MFSVLTLAGGVGVTTVAFALVHALLWTRAPISDPDRIVDVSGARYTGSRSSRSSGAFSWPDFVDLRERQTTFTGLAASTPIDVPFVGGNAAAVVYAEAVNGEYFQTLGVRAAVGRTLQPADDRPDAVPVVVLSYNLWRLRFDADPTALGGIVKVDGQPHQVVGVAPEGFRGWDLSNIGRPPAVWVPLHTVPGTFSVPSGPERQTIAERLAAADRDAAWFAVKARLAPGRTSEQASAEVAAIGRSVDAFFPTPRVDAFRLPMSRLGRQWSVAPPRDERPTSIGRLFVGTVVLVLLIGCTNLANLALARGASREHEFAVRRALGASRADLIRAHLVENGIIAVASGLVALLIIRVVTRMLVMEIPAGPGQFVLLNAGLSLPVVLFAATASLGALAIAGIWPALQLTGSRLRGRLAGAGGATPPHWTLHRRLIGWQVAGSGTLLLLAAACISALFATSRNGSGIDIDRLALVGFSLDGNRYDQPRARAAIDAVLSDVVQRPGIAAAAASDGLPFGGRHGSRKGSVTRADEPLRPTGLANRSVEVVTATPQIFRTLGVTILRGRGVGPGDTAATAPVAVVNDAFARRLWGTPDVVGRDLVLWRTAGRPREPEAAPQRVSVIGVASDTDAGRLGSRDAGVIYVPIDQHPMSQVVFTVRAADGDPHLALATLRSAVRQVNPDLVLRAAGTGLLLLAGGYVVLGFVGSLVTSLGALALLLAMTGLFGVVSQLVSCRTREFGVRLALGASRRRIMQLVLMDGVRPVLGGLALACFAGAVGRSIVASALSSAVPAVDPVEFLTVAVVFLLAALAACYLPARRAARVDPNVALRGL